MAPENRKPGCSVMEEYLDKNQYKGVIAPVWHVNEAEAVAQYENSGINYWSDQHRQPSVQSSSFVITRSIK